MTIKPSIYSFSKYLSVDFVSDTASDAGGTQWIRLLCFQGACMWATKIKSLENKQSNKKISDVNSQL